MADACTSVSYPHTMDLKTDPKLEDFRAEVRAFFENDVRFLRQFSATL